MLTNLSIIRCLLVLDKLMIIVDELELTTVSCVSLYLCAKHCSRLQHMNPSLRVCFLLAVLYKGKFEILFDDSIIYVHSHNEFATLFSGSAVFHG